MHFGYIVDITINNILLLFLSISDSRHSQQCKLFVDQGGVDRLTIILSEDSPKKHRDLALLIKDNVQAWQDRQL
jgi:hypothetical protein